MKRQLFLTVAALTVVGAGVFFTLPRIVDQRMNGVALAAPYSASARATALHNSLFVADLHDDALLWSRDLLTRYSYGHTDLPRLREGKVSLQVFSTVTKTPKGLNFERNAGDTDSLNALVMAQRWPVATWSSLLQRALYQSQKLHQAAAASQGAMQVVRSQTELATLTQGAAPASGKLIAVLATEGLHPLEGKLDNIDTLYDAGFRIMGLTHFFDNEVGGSAHGLEKGGLTPFGKQVVARLQEKSMLVDLAHASPKVINDVLAMTKRPVLVSHTGVQGTCPGPRNLSDAHIKAIAATGGVIGIGYFEGAVCGLDTAAIVKAIRYAVNLAGVKHVALGSDFDGATKTAFDTTGLVLITQGLLEAGFSENDVTDLMGSNVLRLLQTQLPAR
ncbi:dipeptidase [Rhodoferax saidenbachensis]|uniref:Microsomal dipeptidase-like Zn-dependent dipeptidase n=1 Tax=Rhodoferax saidenbachensis TaxID=1484693 RepID=A0ABU1ZN83_9BURK|nr:dipeptidase [Rhodoferax saidenbachensis]MDR7306355.1 microsomal dipeptidase-like Zn-dependent dipeptidase [Rhodoferax saidenbachensis]